MKLLISVSASGDLTQSIEKEGVDPKVLDALTTLSEASKSFKNPSAIAYAGAMRRAYDEYGMEGVKYQVMYLLANAREWKGEEAKACKKILNKWVTV